MRRTFSSEVVSRENHDGGFDDCGTGEGGLASLEGGSTGVEWGKSSTVLLLKGVFSRE